MGPGHCRKNSIVISAGYAVCCREGEVDGLFIKMIIIVLINRPDAESHFDNSDAVRAV
jgi:hypothetical protein